MLNCKINLHKKSMLDFPGGTVVKNSPASSGDKGLIPGLGRFHMRESNSVSKLLSPCALEPVMCNKRSHCSEKQSSPHSLQLEKHSTQQRRLSAYKNKLKFFKKVCPVFICKAAFLSHKN